MVAVVAVLALVLIAAFTGVYLWQQPILLTGTGYAAHNACAIGEVAGRDDPETDLPPNPLVPYLEVSGAGDPTTRRQPPCASAFTTHPCSSAMRTASASS